MSTVADYVGRTSDMLAFQADFSVRKEQQLEYAIVGEHDAGSMVTGIQKLAQRFLLTFFTKRGSIQYLPALGTDFMVRVDQGRLRTTADVRQAFFSALLDTKRQLQDAETEDDPADERYAEATLLNVTLVGDYVTLRVALSSDAGTSVTFIAPITVPIRR